jgi:hypothetical protein
MAHRDDFDRTALELGHISIEWARIEHSLDELIEILIPLDKDNSVLNDAITGNIDIRNKAQIIKAVAFLKQKDKGWYVIITKLINKIDNDLRPRRNGFIHARWVKSKNAKAKITKRTKFLKPQSFTTVLETSQNIKVGINELRKLREEMGHVIICIMVCIWYCIPPTEEELKDLGVTSEKELPPLSFQRYLHLIGFGIRRMNSYLKLSRQP